MIFSHSFALIFAGAIPCVLSLNCLNGNTTTAGQLFTSGAIDVAECPPSLTRCARIEVDGFISGILPDAVPYQFIMVQCVPDVMCSLASATFCTQASSAVPPTQNITDCAAKCCSQDVCNNASLMSDTPSLPPATPNLPPATPNLPPATNAPSVAPEVATTPQPPVTEETTNMQAADVSSAASPGDSSTMAAATSKAMTMTELSTTSRGVNIAAGHLYNLMAGLVMFAMVYFGTK